MAKTKGIVNDIWSNFYFKLFAVIVILLSALRLVMAGVAALFLIIGIGASKI